MVVPYLKTGDKAMMKILRTCSCRQVTVLMFAILVAIISRVWSSFALPALAVPQSLDFSSAVLCIPGFRLHNFLSSSLMSLVPAVRMKMYVCQFYHDCP